MKALLDQYKALPDNLQEYLTDAHGVGLGRVVNYPCNTMAELESKLSELTSQQSLSGWVTRQSDTKLVYKEPLASLFDQTWLQAELTLTRPSGEEFPLKAFMLYYENLTWHLSVTEISEEEEHPNAIAIAHSFNIDTQRFRDEDKEDEIGSENDNLRQINYWVLWQMPDQQNPSATLAPVAQVLRGIEEVDVGNEAARPNNASQQRNGEAYAAQ